ncbi:hypothetical protein Q2Y39_001657 [Campylobacter coli]|uniref:hypothetical protein n=2 Tax=Campylobacteraceae TaxID=72294 RepID=UPI000257E84F|nr:hypothetical protein [Campylobacter coli]EAH7115142.1 hypothetical protein [Campylobacter jejuni]EAK3887914.1 hypothetical protein [Campylobacter hyointestinalis]EAL3816754.1 hypothetical protein [Campylobacter fetus]EIB05280.1 hypothetical protein cco88_09844 [Campylobacter coli LMG 9860]AHK73213.1 hypothetical protein YSQ_04365 [Campylobacter coli RM1875]
MALINFRYFLILLSNMTSIDIEILLEHKNELLKYLSHLGDSSVFEKDKCFKALNNIEQDYFICIGLTDNEKQKDFCKSVFIILRDHWRKFNSTFY